MLTSCGDFEMRGKGHSLLYIVFANTMCIMQNAIVTMRGLIRDKNNSDNNKLCALCTVPPKEEAKNELLRHMKGYDRQ